MESRALDTGTSLKTAEPSPPQRSKTSGFSPTRLVRMLDTLLRHVDSGRLPGLVALISRQRPRGQPPRCSAHARLDLGGVDAPRVRPRCSRLSPLWRPAACYRHRPGPPRRSGHPRPPSPLWCPRAARPCPTRLGRNRVDSSLDPALEASLSPPLHPRLDREPAPAQDHWGPAGALDADPRLRPLDRAVPGPRRGSRGRPDCLDAGRPRGGGVNRSYALEMRVKPRWAV